MVIAGTRMAKPSPPACPSLTPFPEAFAIGLCQGRNAGQEDFYSDLVQPFHYS